MEPQMSDNESHEAVILIMKALGCFASKKMLHMVPKICMIPVVVSMMLCPLIKNPRNLLYSEKNAYFVRYAVCSSVLEKEGIPGKHYQLASTLMCFDKYKLITNIIDKQFNHIASNIIDGEVDVLWNISTIEPHYHIHVAISNLMTQFMGLQPTDAALIKCGVYLTEYIWLLGARCHVRDRQHYYLETGSDESDALQFCFLHLFHAVQDVIFFACSEVYSQTTTNFTLNSVWSNSIILSYLLKTKVDNCFTFRIHSLFHVFKFFFPFIITLIFPQSVCNWTDMVSSLLKTNLMRTWNDAMDLPLNSLNLNGYHKGNPIPIFSSEKPCGEIG